MPLTSSQDTLTAQYERGDLKDFVAWIQYTSGIQQGLKCRVEFNGRSSQPYLPGQHILPTVGNPGFDVLSIEEVLSIHARPRVGLALHRNMKWTVSGIKRWSVENPSTCIFTSTSIYPRKSDHLDLLNSLPNHNWEGCLIVELQHIPWLSGIPGVTDFFEIGPQLKVSLPSRHFEYIDGRPHPFNMSESEKLTRNHVVSADVYSQLIKALVPAAKIGKITNGDFQWKP